jgi:hypothetical protein
VSKDWQVVDALSYSEFKGNSSGRRVRHYWNDSMRRFSVFIAVVTLVGIAGSWFIAPCRQSMPQIEAQRVNLFKWMDEIAIPSARESEFYEITVSVPRPCNNESIVLHGFLICEYLGKRVYFTDDASSFIVDVNQTEEVKIRNIDFGGYVGGIQLSQSPYLESYSSEYCIEMGYRCGLGRTSLNLFPAMRDIILARWCVQMGDLDAADRLWARAEVTMPKLTEGKSIDELFRMYFPAFLLDRAVASMADPATRRADCIARLDWIGTTWNESEYGELALEMRDDLKSAMEMEQILNDELNSYRPNHLSADQLVRQLIDQEFAGGDTHTGFVPFERTGVVSPFSEIMKQSNLTRDLLLKYLESDVPTRLVECEPNELPRMRWVTLGKVAQSLLERIQANSNENQ